MARIFDVGASVLYRAGHIGAPFMTRQAWRQFGAASLRYRRSRSRVAFRALQLYLAGRFIPSESLIKELVDPAVPLREHEKHLSEEHLHGLQNAINSPNAAMCRDKLVFHTYCAYHGLPVTELLGVSLIQRLQNPKRQAHSFRAGLGRVHPESLTPSFSLQSPGLATRAAGAVPSMGMAYGSSAQEVQSLVGALQDLGQHEDYLLEARIEMHPEIVRLTGSSAASCIRLETVIDENGIPKDPWRLPSVDRRELAHGQPE